MLFITQSVVFPCIDVCLSLCFHKCVLMLMSSKRAKNNQLTDRIYEMLKQFLVRSACNAAGLWVAASLLSGINYDGSHWVIIVAALIFSAVNMFIRPLVMLLSISAIILTLGLFTLIVNALMLYLVTVIYPSFEITSFGSAVVAVAIVWLVNYALSSLFQSKETLAHA